MKRWLLVAMLVACSSKQGPSTNGSGGSVTTTPPTGTTCDAAKSKVERLYRAEADAKKEKPERVAEAVADNTQMVMNECLKAPEKVAACIDSVSSSTELEKQCLAPLDEEGTEGEALRK